MTPQSPICISETESTATPTQPSSFRVAAVIVTRNRLSLLTRCLDAVRTQSAPPERVYIVDNASTDGTDVFLNCAPSDVVPIRLHENTGSGGGQYAGMKRAYDDGFDWIWCMDDDGYPSPRSLETLLHYASDSTTGWLNAVVVDPDRPEILSFGMEIGGKTIRQLAELRSIAGPISAANPFNGTLIHRNLMKELGFPFPELFIWGDEVEYLNRALNSRFSVRTITDSIFFHPASMGMPLSQISHSSFWKYYYLVRNCGAYRSRSGTLTLNHSAAFSLARGMIRNLLRDAIIIPVHNIFKCAVILRALIAARRQDLSRPYPRSRAQPSRR